MRYGEKPNKTQTSTKKPCQRTTRLHQLNSLTERNYPSTISVMRTLPFVIIRDFKDRPTVVALKHMNPCGIGQADDIETAWDYAYASLTLVYLWWYRRSQP